MDTTGRELWAYSNYRRCWDQLEGFWEMIHRRAVSISWLYLCLDIDVWMEGRGDAHRCPEQPTELLPEPRGELGTLVGHYVLQETMELKKHETGLPSLSLYCNANRSMTLRMTNLPSEGGKPVTKSIKMWDQG